MALYIMFLDCLMKLSLLIFQWQLRLPGLQWNSVTPSILLKHCGN